MLKPLLKIPKLTLTAWPKALEALWFPPVCLTCHRELANREELLCFSCAEELVLPTLATAEDPEIRRFAGHLPVSQVWALSHFVPKGKVQRLLHELKYRGQEAVGPMMGSILGYKIMQQNIQEMPDLIMPIPLHPKRQRQRGYNQSEAFGRGLSQSLSIPMSCDILLRPSVSESQTKKGREERFQNMEGVFAIGEENAQELQGKHILLVDDVLTTGATLANAGKALLASGAGRISIAVLASA